MTKRTALVTGANRGVGREVARHFAPSTGACFSALDLDTGILTRTGVDAQKGAPPLSGDARPPELPSGSVDRAARQCRQS